MTFIAGVECGMLVTVLLAVALSLKCPKCQPRSANAVQPQLQTMAPKSTNVKSSSAKQQYPKS